MSDKNFRIVLRPPRTRSWRRHWKRIVHRDSLGGAAKMFTWGRSLLLSTVLLNLKICTLTFVARILMNNIQFTVECTNFSLQFSIISVSDLQFIVQCIHFGFQLQHYVWRFCIVSWNLLLQRLHSDTHTHTHTHTSAHPCMQMFESDIAIFVLTRDVKFQPTNHPYAHTHQ